MKTGYIIWYAWEDLWHKNNRSFTFLNFVAISISIGVLVILLGSFLAFRKNSKKMIDKLGLQIEVSNYKEEALTSQQKQALSKIEGVSSIYYWTPTIFLFYNKYGRLYDGIAGRTIDIKDPLMTSFVDIRTNKHIRFLSKEELGYGYDEIGIIVPFIVLKQLSYLPKKAILEKPETWKNIKFPTYLKILIKQGEESIDVKLPIIGIIGESEEGRYFITKDCYNIFGNWKEDYALYLKDRYGKPIIDEIDEPLNEKIKIESQYKDTHGTVYVKSQKYLLKVVKAIRNLNMRADCALEYYLKEYEQQKTFFIAVAGGICIVIFFFTAVVLLSNFNSLILRKLKEIGILKACGSSQLLIYKIFISETIIIAFISITLGIIGGYEIGYQLSSYIQSIFQSKGIEWFSVPLEYLLEIFGGGILFCLLVVFFPLRNITQIDADQVIRTQ